MSERTCETCRWWDGDRRRPKRGRFKNTPGRCTYDAPMPALPKSVTWAYGFNWPLSKSTVWRDDDASDCPTHQPRETGDE